MFKRLISFLVCFVFSLSDLQYVYALDFSVNQLPVPGTMVGQSLPFVSSTLKGLIINPQKPLELQFILDTGKGVQDTASLKEDADRLIKYFLAGLTIPENELWVNLSPYEKDRITTEALGKTALGRDLLAQDYILKQLTASLIYPEKDLGKEFWAKVYTKAQQKFGTTNIQVNTFNKVWILPDQAQIFETGMGAYVTKATLKVMLDEDYLAKKKHQEIQSASISSQIIRQIVLPEITKEVNEGKNFASLRQIYNAMILAKWYKETIANKLLDAQYTNKDKIGGIKISDPTIKEQIYQRYLQAYKKGVFNFIEDNETPDGTIVPRKYFSGGFTEMGMKLDRSGNEAMVRPDGAMLSIKVILNMLFGDRHGTQGSIYGVAEMKKIFQDAVKVPPSDHDIVSTIGRNYLSRFYTAIRRTLRAAIQHPITVYYPGSSTDIAHSLLCTDADTYIFVDWGDGAKYTIEYLIQKIIDKINEMGGQLIEKKINSNVAAEIVFKYRGRQRQLYFYYRIDAGNPKTLPKMVKKGFDVYLEKALGTGYTGGNTQKDYVLRTALPYMRKGGFIITDYRVRSLSNFEDDQRLNTVGILHGTNSNGTLANPISLFRYLTYYNSVDVNSRSLPISLNDALVKASQEGNRNYVKQLLASNKVDDDAKKAALSAARFHGYQEIIGMLVVAGADKAMLQTEQLVKNPNDLGGIDLNNIFIKRTGHVIQMQSNLAQLATIEQSGFEGFSPVITEVTFISSPFQLKE